MNVAAGRVAHIHQIQAGLKESGHAAAEKIDDDAARGGWLNIVIAHRRGGIDDDNREALAGKAQGFLLS